MDEDRAFNAARLPGATDPGSTPISNTRISSGFEAAAFRKASTAVPGMKGFSEIQVQTAQGTGENGETETTTGEEETFDTLEFLPPEERSYATLLEMLKNENDPYKAAKLLAKLDFSDMQSPELHAEFAELAWDLGLELAKIGSAEAKELIWGLQSALEDLYNSQAFGLLNALGASIALDATTTINNEISSINQKIESGGLPDPATMSRLNRFENMARIAKEAEFAASTAPPVYDMPPPRDPRRDLIPGMPSFG